MKYTKEEKRKHLILKCRYYDGTEEDIYLKKLQTHEIDKSNLLPPECMKEEYTLSGEEVAHLRNAHTARCYEEHWVKEQLNGKIDNGCIGEYVAYGNKDFDADDGTPISLKALLWNRYYHWGGWMPDQEAFRKWYRTYYSSEPTNREKRAMKRRLGLVAKCLYYHGEETNPWDVIGVADDNLWRKWYWNLEREWVDALSMSYNTYLAKHDRLKMWGVEDFFKKEDVPLSLINHILGWHNHIAENNNSSLDHDSAIVCYKESYLKMKP